MRTAIAGRPKAPSRCPFTPIFPYHFAGAGNINSNIEDMARWVRLQLGHGCFEGRQIVSPENLAVTRMARVALSDRLSYAMGWYNLETANGTIVWHDGDALSFGSFVGLAPQRNVGVIILTNETNVGFPSALGAWILDRVLGNPEVDYIANKIDEEKAHFAGAAGRFAPPAKPRPFPPLAPLAGAFVSPSFGKASVVVDGNVLIMEIARHRREAQARAMGWRCLRRAPDSGRPVRPDRRSRLHDQGIRPVPGRA